MNYRDDEPATPYYVRCSNSCCQGSGFQWAEPGVFCQECGKPLCRLCGEDLCLKCDELPADEAESPSDDAQFIRESASALRDLGGFPDE